MRPFLALVATLPFLCGFTISGVRIDEIVGSPTGWSPRVPAIGETGELTFGAPGGLYEPFCGSASDNYCTSVYGTQTPFSTTISLTFPSGSLYRSTEFPRPQSGPSQVIVGSITYTDGPLEDTLSIGMPGLSLFLHASNPSNAPDDRYRLYHNPLGTIGVWDWSGTWVLDSYGPNTIRGVVTPEPGSGALLGMSLLALASRRRIPRTRKASN
jgi:PEP-CTERM motif